MSKLVEAEGKPGSPSGQPGTLAAETDAIHSLINQQQQRGELHAEMFGDESRIIPKSMPGVASEYRDAQGNVIAPFHRTKTGLVSAELQAQKAHVKRIQEEQRGKGVGVGVEMSPIDRIESGADLEGGNNQA